MVAAGTGRWRRPGRPAGTEHVGVLLDQRAEERNAIVPGGRRAGRLEVGHPVEQLGKAWLLRQVHLAELAQHVYGLHAQQRILDLVQGEDLVKLADAVRELDVVEDAAPEKRTGQRLLLVVGDDDDGPQRGPVARDGVA
jgi:hypothetical protein